MLVDKSTPNLYEFDPRVIPFQRQLLHDIYNEYDFSLGTHEILCSGSVGSSKSLVGAHIAVRHCIENPKARVLIGRRALPDLKDTLFQKIVEHLEGTKFIEGRDYVVRENVAEIEFLYNGSIIMGKSWADKKYRKFRSLELSMAIIEEAVENKKEETKVFGEIRQRVGRLPHIKENLILYLTNPDSPQHPLYKYFFSEDVPTRHVYYSLTEQNPFLPRTYIEQLKRDLDPKEAQRMLYGKWIEIDSERIYYAYHDKLNFLQTDYAVNIHTPVSISFDFNIGVGKPMSCVVSQYDVKTDTFHFFDESVIHGARTATILEELGYRGLFDYPVIYEIHGDATGGARTTNSNYSNYEIIEEFLKTYKTKSGLKLNYRMLVPKSNPPIKERHNIVNAYCENSLGQRRLFLYKNCKVLNEGMLLTALKQGAQYIEDDSFEAQHSTTALGYRVWWTAKNKVIVKGGNL